MSKFKTEEETTSKFKPGFICLQRQNGILYGLFFNQLNSQREKEDLSHKILTENSIRWMDVALFFNIIIKDE